MVVVTTGFSEFPISEYVRLVNRTFSYTNHNVLHPLFGHTIGQLLFFASACLVFVIKQTKPD